MMMDITQWIPPTHIKKYVIFFGDHPDAMTAITMDDPKEANAEYEALEGKFEYVSLLEVEPPTIH